MADQASISYRGTRITFEVGPGEFRVVDPFVDLEVDPGAPGAPDWLWIAQGLRSLHREQSLVATDIPRLAEDFESILDVPDITVLRPPADARRLELLLFHPDERVREWARRGLAGAPPPATSGNGGGSSRPKQDWTAPASGGTADWAPAKPVWSSSDPRGNQDVGYTGASRTGTSPQLPPPMADAPGGGYGGYGTGYGGYGTGYGTAYGRGAPISITNYLPWGIAVTLLCCLIGGIVTIVYASQANSAAAVGDPTALEKEKKAKTWLIASIVIGVLFNAAYLYLTIASAGSTRYRY